jgi:hypothetical protein
MMHCFVCHPTQLEFLDAQRGHKGLVSYNKNHDTNALKKYACHEYNFRVVQKWGLFLLQRVKETQSEKQGSKKRKIVPPSQITYLFGSQRPYHKSNPLH